MWQCNEHMPALKETLLHNSMDLMARLYHAGAALETGSYLKVGYEPTGCKPARIMTCMTEETKGITHNTDPT